MDLPETGAGGWPKAVFLIASAPREVSMREQIEQALDKIRPALQRDGGDIELVDVEEGKQEVPKGEPGEIIIKSPLIMKEYWNNAEETAGQIKDGWLYTGDLYTIQSG